MLAACVPRRVATPGVSFPMPWLLRSRENDQERHNFEAMPCRPPPWRSPGALQERTTAGGAREMVATMGQDYGFAGDVKIKPEGRVKWSQP